MRQAAVRETKRGKQRGRKDGRGIEKEDTGTAMNVNGLNIASLRRHKNYMLRGRKILVSEP